VASGSICSRLLYTTEGDSRRMRSMWEVTAHGNSYQLMIIAYWLFDCGRNELDFKATMSLKNSWNENYSIRVGRDGQVCMQFVSNNRCLDDVEYS